MGFYEITRFVEKRLFRYFAPYRGKISIFIQRQKRKSAYPFNDLGGFIVKKYKAFSDGASEVLSCNNDIPSFHKCTRI